MAEVHASKSNPSTKGVSPRRRTRKENVIEAEKYSSILRESNGSYNPLASFCPKPANVSFEVQHEDEPILLLLRQHPIVNIRWMIIATLMLLAPLSLNFFPLLDWLPERFQFVALIGWYSLTFGFILENFLIWFFNIYIITDERVIDVDFFNLLFKKVSEAKIENIEDITSATGGFLQSVIDFGEVRIQTSAEIPQIEFDKVPHPGKVATFLSEMLVQEEQEKIEGRVR